MLSWGRCAILIVVIGQLWASGGYGQTLRGLVYDVMTRRGLSLASVEVRLGDSLRKAYSDTTGGFELEGLPMGRAEVRVTCLDYVPWEASSVVLLAGRDAYLMVGLYAEEVSIAEVSVLARGGVGGRVSARALSSEEVNRYAGSWGDAARMVTNTAGVVSVGDMRNDIVVRGNSPLGVQWQVDGFELSNPNHYGSLGGTGGVVSMLNSTFLATSTFFTGAFPAEYGNVTSGLFDMQLHRGNAAHHEFTAGMGFNGVEASAQGPLGRRGVATYIASARYSILELMKAIGVVRNMHGVPRYHDVMAKITLPYKRATFEWLALWGRSRIETAQEQQGEADYQAGPQVFNQWVDNRNRQFFTGICSTYAMAEGVRIEGRLSYQLFARNVEVTMVGYPRDTGFLVYRGYEREDRYDGRAELSWLPTSRSTLRCGIGGTLYGTALGKGEHSRIRMPAEAMYSGVVRAFAQWHYHFAQSLALRLGVYGQCYALNGDYAVEPRAMLRWAAQGSSIGIAAGMHSQLLPRQLYFYREGLDMPNRELGAARSWQAVLSAGQHLVESVVAKVEIYYIGHYRVPVPVGVPQESFLNMGDSYYDDWGRCFVNGGRGRNYGVELTLERPFRKGYYFTFTGTWYRADYSGHDGAWRPGKYAGDFGVTAVGGYEWRLLRSLLLGVNARCVCLGGKRYTPSYKHSTGRLDISYERAYEGRTPFYFRLDLNVTMKQNFSWGALESYVEVTNVTNRRNVREVFYDEAFGKPRAVYENAIMPMGGVRFYF